MIYAAFVACCLIWGSTFLAIRIGNETVAPVWAAAIRLVLASAALSLIVLLTSARFPRGAALRGAVLFGLFNFGINFVLLYIGENSIPSGIAAVLFATVPLSTSLMAGGFHVEPLVPRKVIAAVVAVAGVATIFAGEIGLAVPLAGLLTVLIAATFASLSGVLLKQAPPQPAIPANAVGAAVGAVVCIAASFVLGEDHALPVTAAAWVPIVYLTVAGSLGAFVLFAWLIKVWSVSNASFIGVVAPIVAVILGAIVKQERPSPLALVGALIVIGAVVFALWPSRTSRPAVVHDPHERFAR